MIETCFFTPLSYLMDTSVSRGWDKGFFLADHPPELPEPGCGFSRPSYLTARQVNLAERYRLEAGASVAEIFEVLKLCVSQGVQACNLGVPILQEELACRSGQGKA